MNALAAGINVLMNALMNELTVCINAAPNA